MSGAELPNFEGLAVRECGEHRTVGPHRAWCYDCSEWCYPSAPCVRCERPTLVPQVSRDELREAIADTVAYLVEDMREPDIADAVLELLAERGLARPADPSGREGNQE